MRHHKITQPLLLGLLLSGLAGGPAWAGPPPAGPKFVPVMTRLMKLLGDREQDLQLAISRRQRSLIESIVADDFQEQTGLDAQVVSTPYADWLEPVLQHPGQATFDSLHVISAREFGEYTALSFIGYASKPSGGKPEARFVVDMWKHMEDDQWKLVARYNTASAGLAEPAKAVPTGKK